MEIQNGVGNGFERQVSIDDTMSYSSQRNQVGTLFEGEISRRLSTFSSKKLFAVLLKDDYNLYTIEAKRLPKNRPSFVSPFTQDLTFDESTKSIGRVAYGWRQLDLRKCAISPASKDGKNFIIAIPPPKNGKVK